jgi:hypothetical protein
MYNNFEILQLLNGAVHNVLYWDPYDSHGSISLSLLLLWHSCIRAPFLGGSLELFSHLLIATAATVTAGTGNPSFLCSSHNHNLPRLKLLVNRNNLVSFDIRTIIFPNVSLGILHWQESSLYECEDVVWFIPHAYTQGQSCRAQVLISNFPYKVSAFYTGAKCKYSFYLS